MQPILLVTPEGRAEETIKRLARVGYDNAIGYLEGGFETWGKSSKEIDTISTINVNDFAAAYEKNKELNILDVRKPGEWSGMHIEGSQNFSLDFISDNMSEVDLNKSYYMHCRSGYRSTVAASILKARGFEKFVNVHGTFDAVEASVIPTTEFVCPSTLKK